MTDTTPTQLHLTIDLSLELELVAAQDRTPESIKDDIAASLTGLLTDTEGAMRADFGTERSKAEAYFSDPQDEDSPVWGGYDGPMVVASKLTIKSI